MKIHLACGTVYLDGWVNVDIDRPNHFFAEERPDIVEQNKTDIDHYYKSEVTKKDFLEGKYHSKDVVVDIFSDIGDLPYEPNSITEILGVQILEHFSLNKAEELLTYWYSLLRPNGKIRLHVPDVEGILTQWAIDTDTKWAIRQLYGSQKNKYSVHKYGYTEDSLKDLMKSCGYTTIRRIDNINSYPAFGVVGYKR